MSTTVGQLNIRLVFDQKQLNTSLDKTKSVNEKAAQDFTKAWSAAASLANSFIDRAFNSIANTISSSIGSAIKRVDTLNAFPKMMQIFGVSSDEAAESIQRISDRMKGLPTSLDMAAGGVQNLFMVTKDLSLAEDLFYAVNDAAMVFANGSTESVDHFVYAYKQAMSSGKVSAEDFNQMNEAIPGLMDKVAESMNMTYAELKEGLSKGSVSMDDFNNTLKKLDSEGSGSMGSLSEAAKSATGGIDTAIANMQSAVNRGMSTVIKAIGEENIEAALSAIGKKFEELGNTVSNIIHFFQENEWALNALKGALVAVAGVLGTIKIVEFGQKVADVTGKVTSFSKLVGGGFISGLKSVGTILLTKVIPAVASFSTTLLTSPITWIVAGITAVVAAVVLLIANFDKVKEVVGAVFGWIGDRIGEFAAWIGSIFEAIGQTIGGAFEGIGNFIGEVVNNIVGFFTGLWETVVGIFTSIVEFLTNVFSVPIAVVTKLIEIILKIGEIITVLVYTTVVVAVNFFVGLFQNLWNVITTGLQAVGAFFGAVFEAIWSIVSGVVESITSAFSAAWDWLMGALTAIGEFFGMIFENVWLAISTVVENVKGAFQGAWDFITGVFGAVGNWFRDRFNEAFTAIKNVFKGVGDFFKGVWDTIVKVFTEVGTAVGDAVGGAFKTVVNTVIGFVEGFINGVVGAVNFFIDIINGIIGVVGGHIDSLAPVQLDRMEYGGIIPGTDYTGDKRVVRINSGEMVITRGQQGALWNAIESGNFGTNVSMPEPATAEVDTLALAIAKAFANEMDEDGEDVDDLRPIEVTNNNYFDNAQDADQIGDIILESMRRASI